MQLLSVSEKGLENFNFLKYKLYLVLLVIILLVGCATTEQPKTQEPIPAETAPTETAPPAEESQEEVKTEIPADIKEVLEKAKTKLTSYSYNYKNPSTDVSDGISVKGSKIKITLAEKKTEEEDKFYNTIYLDTEEKTAEAHCVGYSDCEGKVEKVKDLNYDDVSIETPVDWVAKVTEAEKIDERTVESRKSLYLDTNIGKITIASYNGFIYKIEKGSQIWEFSDASFGSVKDSDVTPT